MRTGTAALLLPLAGLCLLAAGRPLIDGKMGTEPAGSATNLPPRPEPLGLRMSVDSANRDLVMEVGPVDLPADGEHKQLPAFHGRVPLDGWLHGFSVELVDEAGRPVPRITLHHVNVIATGQRELFSQIMLRVAAAGQETDPVALPRMVGYRVRRGQELIVTSMLHNPTGRAYKGVRLRVRFPYTPADARLKPISIQPFYIDVMPPASLHSYDLPPGRSRRTWDARPAIAARILGVGGHMHQYGTALRLEDVTAKRVIWEARPTIGRDGEVASMPQTYFVWRLGVAIRPDHLYRVTAEYNNTSGQTIPGGAMGTVGGAVMPDDPSRWPAVDRNHPELKLDWRLVHTGNQNGHMHMQMGGGAASHGAASPAPGHTHGAAAAPSRRHDGMAMQPPAAHRH